MNQILFLFMSFVVGGLLLTPATADAAGLSFVQFGITQAGASLLLVAVIIGVLYSLWRTTKAYGGIIGQGLRRIGLGIIFLVIEALDRVVQNFGSNGIVAGLMDKQYQPVTHDGLLLLGLFFLTLGFVKFSSAVKG